MKSEVELLEERTAVKSTPCKNPTRLERSPRILYQTTTRVLDVLFQPWFGRFLVNRNDSRKASVKHQ